MTVRGMIGRRLGRYEIIEMLGAGGMGVVYRARDMHLERDVALKVLPEGTLGDEPTRRRFRREALILARLSHANIGTIFDFDTQDGVDFLVMEYVEGQTLAERIAAGPLAESEVAVLGPQVAEALQAAHDLGVVHRDLKPGNVMVTPSGQVKVLDFGLARLRNPTSENAPTAALGGAATLSGPGILAGTLPYMAPEQLLGRPVDHRSDLFALGALLYEMTTGRPPFTETLPSALVNEIVSRAPRPPRQINPSLTSRVEEIIGKCLEKDPERRYASARDVAMDLRRLGRGAVDTRGGAPRIESIAVLPLENLSRDPEQEYFADGMTEALISDLARIGALRVISRTSAMQYKGVRKPLPEIARELNVDAIVEGSVLRVEGRVRISAQLIEAATDRHLWAERYERDLCDVLALQSEVAQAIACGIQVQLTGAEKARLALGRRIHPEAHESYLKGRHFWNLRTTEGLERGIEYFNRAIELDPTYAPAYSGLADCYNILADRNQYPPAVAFPKAKAAALKAVELDERLAEAHTSLAYVFNHHEWDWAAAERAYRRAIELDRGYPTALQWYGHFLTTMKRFEEGTQHSLEAIKRDPLSRILYLSAGDTYYYSRRFELAVEMCRRAIDFDRNFYLARFDLGRALEQLGRYDEAIAEYMTGLAAAGAAPTESSALACTLAFAGRTEEARAILARLKGVSGQRYIPPYQIASIHAALRETDHALDWLEKAYAARDRAMVFLQVNPRLDGLRSSQRFAALVRRMGFPA